MNIFEKSVEIRWADLDPNFHVLHSKYYDFGAYCRTAFLIENGLTPMMMAQLQIGPVLFREECIFKRELVFGDKVTINMKVEKLTADFGRWSMVHEIFKNDSTLSAIINIDGAWLNTAIRKLAAPPTIVQAMFDKAPKTDTFTII
ncbi:acyl-CoA thioesterase [Ferruginibacter yonginensis]|uniref:Acyl-CoA thioesterase n=1 Tax=Ferruginibacter yonginensis TaxID=1310416 RepID=A0ABV8QVC6_9BACT